MKYNEAALHGFVLCVKNALPPCVKRFDEDGPLCAECGTRVGVRGRRDYGFCDICDACAQKFFTKVREAYHMLENYK